MDELQGFLFDGAPVRGAVVRLDAGWRELLGRRAAGPYPGAVRALLGEMAAAAVLLRSNIKFDGRLILQMHGDGPLQLAVAEVNGDLQFRATATLRAGAAPIADDADLSALLNVHGQGRCAITLDAAQRRSGQQPYQGVVPLHGDRREPLRRLAPVLEHYMLQSEQLDTRLLLAANDSIAAGLLLQRLPVDAAARMSGERNEDQIGRNEDFNRIAHLAATLTQHELLTLDAHTLLHRLFWQERLMRFVQRRPHFGCTCTRERVRNMLRGLGAAEVEGIIAERGDVEITCEFCGRQYRFDAVDAGGLFTPSRDQPDTPAALQ